MSTQIAFLLSYWNIVTCWHWPDTQHYCRICADHTMCIFKSPEPGPMCTSYERMPLSLAEKEAILHDHNRYRSWVAVGNETRGAPGPQPAAANMAELMWDNELEVVAQKWTDQCHFDDHDTCRDVGRFQVGQNMLAVGNMDPVFISDVPYLVQKWYDEVDVFDASVVECYRMPNLGASEWGHYTQVVWAETTKVGCSRTVFKTTNIGLAVTMEFLVCNYGPAGNFNGRTVYEIGMPASKCKSGAPSQKYSGLCDISREDVTQLVINQENKKKKKLIHIERKEIGIRGEGLGNIVFRSELKIEKPRKQHVQTKTIYPETFADYSLNKPVKADIKFTVQRMGLPFQTENHAGVWDILGSDYDITNSSNIAAVMQNKRNLKKFEHKIFEKGFQSINTKI